MFHKGQKVVCVDDKPRHQFAPLPIRKDVVYTIRAANVRGKGVYLEEIVSPMYPDGLECSFYTDRFRPVVDRKTELPACITALLDTSKFKELCGND